MENNKIHIFYACDDNFVKYTIVSLYSMIKNASTDYKYCVHVLHNDITVANMERVYGLANDNFEIVFDDVSDYLNSIKHKLPIRDYYSRSTYYRLFIAEMFPDINKALYIDSDTIIQGDISRLYNKDIKDAYVGACHEQAMIQVDEYGTYAEKVVGVSRYNFFNAGILIINCEQFRLKFVLDKFIEYLHTYDFVVTQDEDYLNLICKDHVYWVDQRWNTEVYCNVDYPIEQAKIIHYIMTSKPWHYEDCKHGDIFWKYAKETCVYQEMLDILHSFTDEDRAKDALAMENLPKLAVAETNREDNFVNRMNKYKRDHAQVAILQKIEEYERAGRFEEDVEDDPPGRVLQPDEIEYIRTSRSEKIKTGIAYRSARKFVDSLIKDKKLIIKEIKGIENFKNLNTGAIIVCNHFNAFDSFAMQLAYEAANQPNRTFYRVIREGNYTSFPGFYGYLMRHCNTLPLSSNPKTLTKFVKATNQLLQEGHYVLVYPEQSMWWNYRKPKPLQKGAYVFAVKNNVPVLPCFITMKDSDIIGEDGFFVQEYTIHIAEPIYPNPEKKYGEKIEEIMAKNSEVWKNIYEEEYQMPLTYLTEQK